ncbi:MAG TPA: peptide chain release factor N(5)-glutamine methyltransferase [Bryobacteraceae bacterium]|nr:peptide chain release factor N(5)-glutamine methyltransferase [Bryobacteraceae bacterium]
MTGFLTIRTALQQGTRLLEEGSIIAPRLTAEVLLCHALRCERPYLYSHSENELTQLVWLHYGRYLHQRLCGTPTQYITKKQEFYGRDFYVDPNVLIPRPETELVVETALGRLGRTSRVVDIGCGSGAIAVTLQLEIGCTVFATDISAGALAVARSNSDRLDANVSLIHADLLMPFRGRTLDMVVSNPPYIAEGDRASLAPEVRDHEPALALFAGDSGNDIYASLIVQAARVLRPGGFLVLELGYSSLPEVRDMLGREWQNVEASPDLAGIPRVLAAELKPQ